MKKGEIEAHWESQGGLCRQWLPLFGHNFAFCRTAGAVDTNLARLSAFPIPKHARKLRGIWEEILDCLVMKERLRQSRQQSPSLLAIDSQSVKVVQYIDEETGVDGNKKIKGRKRSIAVDRLGLSWSLAATSANTSDNEAGRLVVDRL